MALADWVDSDAPGKQPWLALGCDGHRSDHVESEQAQHGEVFLSNGLFLQLDRINRRPRSDRGLARKVARVVGEGSVPAPTRTS